jgi:hypothetical protein
MPEWGAQRGGLESWMAQALQGVPLAVTAVHLIFFGVIVMFPFKDANLKKSWDLCLLRKGWLPIFRGSDE